MSREPFDDQKYIERLRRSHMGLARVNAAFAGLFALWLFIETVNGGWWLCPSLAFFAHWWTREAVKPFKVPSWLL